MTEILAVHPERMKTPHCLLLSLLIFFTAWGAAAGDSVGSGLQTNAIREIAVVKKFLNLPVKNGGPRRRLSLSVEGRIVRDFDIELAEADPDYWVFLDLTEFRGKRAMLKASGPGPDSRALDLIEQGDQLRDAENLYDEPARPQFHFSSARGWLNDPNGLVFYKGEYHLYYQHNPYGWKWGNMHWGHAVSRDLVHWRELPMAIYPQRYGDWAFSGSAVVDARNTAGFKSGKDDVIVAAYTSTGRGECIVYSNDRGRTFKEFSGNPVVKHRGRDPRLFWHQPTGQWVMVVYDEDPSEPDRIKQRQFVFYTSPNLKDWTCQSRILGFYECPDFFELPVDGDSKRRKWILTDASSQYMVGEFDGRTFTPETGKLPGHRGVGFYAAQTYSDIPARDGRRIQIGWMRAATPGMPFNQMMSFPCELTLRTTEAGPRLLFQPVKELKSIYGKKHQWKNLGVEPGKNPTAEVRGDLLDINADLEADGADSVELVVRGLPITCDLQRGMIRAQGVTNALPVVKGRVRLRVLADRTSFEIFGNDGALFMPVPVDASRPGTSTSPPLLVKATGRSPRIRALIVTELKPAWNENSELRKK
jgi:fructan beta-fructosidase